MKCRHPGAIECFVIISCLFLTSTVFFSNSAGEGGGTRSDGGCNQFRGDERNSGICNSEDIPTNELAWKFRTDAGIESSPAVVGEKVYFGSKDGNVYCLDAVTGVEIWRFSTEGDISSSPLVVGGKLYIGSGDKHLFCINAEYGIEQWSIEVRKGIISSPKLYNDKIYFGSDEGKIHCIHADNGTEAWNHSISEIRTDVWSTPAFKDNLLYIGDSSGRMVCLDTENGALIYNIDVEGDIYGSVSVNSDDIVFPSGIGRTVYRYNGKTAQLIWEFETSTDVYTSASIYGGRVFFSDYEYVYCLPFDEPDANGLITPGEVIWKFEAENFEGGSSPLLISDRLVIGMGNTLHCLQLANGTEDWRMEFKGKIVSSPVYGCNNLYIACSDGFIYCLRGRVNETLTENDDEFDMYLDLTVPIGIFIVLDIALVFAIVSVRRKRGGKKT